MYNCIIGICSSYVFNKTKFTTGMHLCYRVPDTASVSTCCIEKDCSVLNPKNLMTPVCRKQSGILRFQSLSSVILFNPSFSIMLNFQFQSKPILCGHRHHRSGRLPHTKTIAPKPNNSHTESQPGHAGANGLCHPPPLHRVPNLLSIENLSRADINRRLIASSINVALKVYVPRLRTRRLDSLISLALDQPCCATVA